MSPRFINCEQRSPEWFECRRGLPTASVFADILAKGRDGGVSKTRRVLLLKLAGERITGNPMENFTNVNMDRGTTMEHEARLFYAFVNDAPLKQVGFIANGQTGCSPDALIGDDGVLELKTALPHILLDKLLKDTFPPEHKAQTQGALWVSEREWVDLAIYWPGLPLFVKRSHRDEAYISELANAVAAFNDELDATVERVRRYGQPPPKRAPEQSILDAG